ncbi:MAG: preprotein translocase subunit SecA [Proteobacteria bacterium]|nr:preprotein translocase subunit SecA [Pseudomonadota bacterium]
MGIIEKIFGSKNEREIRKLRPAVNQINELEATMKAKSDAELKAMTAEFRERLDRGASPEDILSEAFAVVREAGVRTLGMRHFDVQLIGGMVLHQGRIAEMRTGEGKTLVATLPAYLNGLTGRGVHVVTVNDYLARRDAEWMGKLYNFLDLSVGVIVHGIDDYGRQRQYRSDITYGQNNEFGFDYLRDNMKMSPDRMVQRELHYSIVDEVDSILIDEARTPLIISGPAEQSADLYRTVNKVVPRLKRDIDYTVDEKAHSAMLTDLGVERVEKLLDLDNLYDPANISYNHHVTQALRAYTLYKRDVNYLVRDGKVIIIDEHTGRVMPGRRWSDGLHQAIEAKEGVVIEEENQTLATITFQNYFRLYEKLSGMTGTADTEAAEFHQIYKLDVSVIPTNKPIIRDDAPDLVYKNERGKFRAVIDDIRESHERGQPVLVGTVSVEKSEVVAEQLKKAGLQYNLLNAKQHESEAGIVAQAGRKGAITISTNMAGRGTDIVLGGNSEVMAKTAVQREMAEYTSRVEEMRKAQSKKKKGGGDIEVEEFDEDGRFDELFAKYTEQCDKEREEVLQAGGLRIIGTERHESRRIDNQLRGRSGRQGDPGGSRFYLSLDDDLLRIFGAERITGLMERLGMEEDVPIEHSWVTKAIENAQKKVEGRNFDQRKNVLEYDDVMNQQRKTIYSLRRQILEGRYEPELSEDEIKAGKKPEPPTQSGDWTVESLSEQIRKNNVTFIDHVIEHYEEDRKKRQEEGLIDDDTLPLWRFLRAELWRTTGCLCDLERRINGPREELYDYVVDSVARSLIQQRERVYDLCETMIGQHLDTYCPPGTHEDDWDLDGLNDALRDQFNTDIEVPTRDVTQQQVAERVWEQLEKRIDDREKELSRPWLMYFARHFYLEEIDQQWIDHLKTMDHLREGIYLRGYGQKDPKKEYKKEGFSLFAEMMERIQANACTNLFRVQIQRDDEEEVPELQAKRRRMTAVHPAADGGGASAAYGDAADGSKKAVEKQKTVRRTTPKVGRNDPCPCGSGKKYKKCHGRPGAEASL